MHTQTLRARSGHVVGKRGGTTRKLILEELAAQLQDRPLAEVSVIEVARGVQCSPATFYQYFTDIKAASVALARMLKAAGEQLPDGLVDQRAEAERLRIAVEAALPHVLPCVPPDFYGGWAVCTHGQTWPCAQTEAAWLLRGLDPDAERAKAMKSAQADMTRSADTEGAF